MKKERASTTKSPPKNQSSIDLRQMGPPGSEPEPLPLEEGAPEPRIEQELQHSEEPYEEKWTWQRIVRVIMAFLGSILALVSLRSGPVQAGVPLPGGNPSAVRVMDNDTDTSLHTTIKKIRSALPDIALYGELLYESGSDRVLQADAGGLLKNCIADLESVLAEVEVDKLLQRTQDHEKLLDNLVLEVRQCLEQFVSPKSNDQLEQLREFVGAINDILEDYERRRKEKEWPQPGNTTQGA